MFMDISSVSRFAQILHLHVLLSLVKSAWSHVPIFDITLAFLLGMLFKQMYYIVAPARHNQVTY